MKLLDDKIVEDLADSLGLRFFSEEDRNKILTETLEVINKKAGQRIIENFSDEETEEFNKIPEDDLEQMEDFMIARNSRAKDIFKEEAEEVKEKLLKAKVEV
jgi:(p)ppGpp synthase/HD superfamily hydrolase